VAGFLGHVALTITKRHRGRGSLPSREREPNGVAFVSRALTFLMDQDLRSIPPRPLLAPTSSAHH
jgi:hypothetical protein